MFLDFDAGIAVNSTGHCHPAVVEAIQRQAGQLVHYSAATSTCRSTRRLRDELAASRRSRRRRASTSATPARRSSRRRSSSPAAPTGRPYVVAFLGAFHGRTYGSISLTASKAKYHAGFGPLLPGVYHAPYGASRTCAGSTTSCSSGSSRPTRSRRSSSSRSRARAATSCRRTASWRACADLRRARHPADRRRGPVRDGPDRPDVGRRPLGRRARHPAAAKGIASGMPLGAMIARREVMEAWGPGAHGSTYGGNPVACAAALATIDLLEGGLIDNARVRGEQAMTGLHRSAAASGAGQRRPRRGPDDRVEFPTAEIAEAVEWACFTRVAGPRVRRFQHPPVASAGGFRTGGGDGGRDPARRDR